MLNSFYAVIAAAIVAAIVAVATAPQEVSAGPLPVAEAASIKSCAERPWPYLRCVGTRHGNPKVRLVTTERFAG